MTKKDRFTLDRRRFLKVAGAGLAAPAIAGLPHSVLAQDQVELTFWAWTPDTQIQVDMFEKAYPNISVKLENVGQGEPHYTKLRNAIRAGTGLPDLAQMEFNSIRSFRQLQSLADIGPEVSDVKDKFIPWTWDKVSDGDAVYSVPWDSGPMGLLYREDLLSDNGIDVPNTWDDFADAAIKLAEAAPGTYLTNFGASDPGWIGGVLWQVGSRPFHTEGIDIQIAVNDAPAKKWAEYWQALVDAKAVDTSPAWTTEWFAGLDNGTYASWVTAAWGPVLMLNSMKESFGKWRASQMPQWSTDKIVTSNWGGSTFAVFTTSEHPKEAALFAKFMGSNVEAAKIYNTKQYLFPVLKELINDQALMGHAYDFYSGQKVNEVFVESSKHVDPSFEFAPFQDYVNAQIRDEFTAAVGGNGTLSEALDRVQDTVVQYAKDQGFNVT